LAPRPGTPSLLPTTNAAPNGVLTVHCSNVAGLPADVGLVLNISVPLVFPELAPWTQIPNHFEDPVTEQQ
jgi:hypothetical protein